MKLTKEEKRPRVIITTRCNFRCSYCTVLPAKVKEIAPEKWVALINAQLYTSVVFTGGDPLIYPGLFDVIRGIRIPSTIYTNLKAWKHRDIRRLDRGKTDFLISWHPEYVDTDEFIVKVVRLRSAGFKLTVTAVVDDAFGDRSMTVAALNSALSIVGIRIVLADDQRLLWPQKFSGFCHNDRTIFGPDGRRYPCVGLMKRGLNQIPPAHFEGTVCNEKACEPCDAFALGVR